jgi:hypothetical protein
MSGDKSKTSQMKRKKERLSSRREGSKREEEADASDLRSRGKVWGRDRSLYQVNGRDSPRQMYCLCFPQIILGLLRYCQQLSLFCPAMAALSRSRFSPSQTKPFFEASVGGVNPLSARTATSKG